MALQIYAGQQTDILAFSSNIENKIKLEVLPKVRSTRFQITLSF